MSFTFIKEFDKTDVTLPWGGRGDCVLGSCGWASLQVQLGGGVKKQFRYSLSFLRGVNEIKECKISITLMVQSRLYQDGPGVSHALGRSAMSPQTLASPGPSGETRGP